MILGGVRRRRKLGQSLFELPRLHSDDDTYYNIEKNNNKSPKSTFLSIRRRPFILLITFLAVVGWMFIYRSFDENTKIVLMMDEAIRYAWIFLENNGIIENPPPFSEYHKVYPFLTEIEQHLKVFQEETIDLFAQKRKELRSVGYMIGGRNDTLYIPDWKSVGFKMGGIMVEENEKYFPKTFEIIRKSSPKILNAFLSIVEPNTHVNPHWGYYKGFSRYLLPLMVPNNNQNNETYIRVSRIEKQHHWKVAKRMQQMALPETYVHYFKEGQGLMFDDTMLHDVFNNSPDEARVVLFMDIVRKLPWFLYIFNEVALWVLNHYNAKMADMRRRSVVP